MIGPAEFIPANHNTTHVIHHDTRYPIIVGYDVVVPHKLNKRFHVGHRMLFLFYVIRNEQTRMEHGVDDVDTDLCSFKFYRFVVSSYGLAQNASRH